MKKKLSIKNLEVKSFVTSLDHNEKNNLKGAGTDIVHCGSRVDACLTAQACYPTNNITCFINETKNALISTLAC